MGHDRKRPKFSPASTTTKADDPGFYVLAMETVWNILLFVERPDLLLLNKTMLNRIIQWIQVQLLSRATSPKLLPLVHMLGTIRNVSAHIQSPEATTLFKTR